MLLGGIWSSLVNLGLFAWSLRSGRSLAEAMSITFVALVGIQLVNAYNYRSDRHSALLRPFANRWLNGAIVWELALLALVMNVPVLREAFGGYRLTLADWALTAGVSLTILPVIELGKWVVRRGKDGPRPGPS